MTVDEAKGLFALMGWKWQAEPLSKGNNVRGRLPELYIDAYQVFVNEVMEEHRTLESRASNKTFHVEYERYDLDRCLTRYADLYIARVAGVDLSEVQRQAAHKDRSVQA